MTDILKDYQWLLGLIAGFVLNIIKDSIFNTYEEKKVIRILDLSFSEIEENVDIIMLGLPSENDKFDKAISENYFDIISDYVYDIESKVNEIKQYLIQVNSQRKYDFYHKKYKIYYHFSKQLLELLKRRDILTENKENFDMMILAIRTGESSVNAAKKYI